jgi:hypothetical protein
MNTSKIKNTVIIRKRTWQKNEHGKGPKKNPTKRGTRRTSYKAHGKGLGHGKDRATCPGWALKTAPS